MGKLTCLQTLQYFEVGIEQGRRLVELGRLENLRGELTIRGLQLVGNKEEAQTTYLQEKPNIYRMAYLWSHDEPEGCETNDKHVKIPLLGQLKFLRHLELVGFHKVECIGTTFYAIDGNNKGNIQVFPSLKELVLEDMPSLIEWKGVELIPTTNGGRDEVIGVRMFPGLEKLRITKCPLLKSTPNQFEILRELIIEGVDSGVPLLNLCSNLTSLVKLYLSDVKELTCLPDEILHNNVSLQFLSVSDCGEFREFPQSLYNLHSLKSLEISFCTNFSSFPVPSGENYWTSLQSLQLFVVMN
ncbi:putative disease resistance protein RGA3 [Solanum stenotomum]|uniref:putative disease resistance protein RGA3 n=1 Tax=Solanum stenotomum TaxID=172797 RepID=UPI0020CFF40A|nr:putative disease resistance protein RGA3 [Solanum stenotomum]